jgi:hypothetical protein
MHRVGIDQLVYRTVIGWMARAQLLAGVRDFSLLHNVQTSFGAHQASYAMDTRAQSLMA